MQGGKRKENAVPESHKVPRGTWGEGVCETKFVGHCYRRGKSGKRRQNTIMLGISVREGLGSVGKKRVRRIITDKEKNRTKGITVIKKIGGLVERETRMRRGRMLMWSNNTR